jgi:hypothetical protein
MISRIDISTGLKRCITKDCDVCPYAKYRNPELGDTLECTGALAQETLLLLGSDMNEIELLNQVVQKKQALIKELQETIDQYRKSFYR